MYKVKSVGTTPLVDRFDSLEYALLCVQEMAKIAAMQLYNATKIYPKIEEFSYTRGNKKLYTIRGSNGKVVEFYLEDCSPKL